MKYCSEPKCNKHAVVVVQGTYYCKEHKEKYGK